MFKTRQGSPALATEAFCTNSNHSQSSWLCPCAVLCKSLQVVLALVVPFWWHSADCTLSSKTEYAHYGSVFSATVTNFFWRHPLRPAPPLVQGMCCHLPWVLVWWFLDDLQTEQFSLCTNIYSGLEEYNSQSMGSWQELHLHFSIIDWWVPQL